MRKETIAIKRKDAIKQMAKSLGLNKEFNLNLEQ